MTIPEHRQRLRNRLAGPAGDELTLAQYGRIIKAIERAHTHQQLREVAKELRRAAPIART